MKKLIIGITAEGSVNLLLGQLKYFKSLGYQTYLLGPYSERSATFCEKEGCEHLVIDIEREISVIKDLKTLLSIISVFRKIKPDVINLGTPKVSLLGMIAGYFMGVNKRLYTCRGFRFEHEVGSKRKVLIWMERITSKLAHQVISISDSVQRLGMTNRIFSKEKSEVILKGSSNGVNLELFNPEIKKHKSVREGLLLKYDLKDRFVFGFLGRIVDRKGINELLRVFDTLYEKDKSIRLMLVGPFELSQIADKDLMRKIENHSGIISCGRVAQEEVPGYMLAMDVFVLPAWWEGFGNVLVQAAAMGVPVISTKGTGTIDAVSDGYNGILIPVKNEEKLKGAMNALYQDEALRAQYGSNGKLWAQNFKRELIWEALDEVYSR